jgi:hypothetical protein
MRKTMKPSIKFTSPEIEAAKEVAKKNKVVRPALKISASPVKLVEATFEDLQRAVKKEETVYLVNAKKGTSLRGKLISWENQDEGKESAIFRQLFKKRFIKVQLGQIYIENERA